MKTKHATSVQTITHTYVNVPEKSVESEREQEKRGKNVNHKDQPKKKTFHCNNTVVMVFGTFTVYIGLIFFLQIVCFFHLQNYFWSLHMTKLKYTVDIQ